MKGGGLTWAGWLMVGSGAMLLYAGMTGQSVVKALSEVLNGKTPKAPAPGTVPGPPSAGAPGDSEKSDHAAIVRPPAVPLPTAPAPTGGAVPSASYATPSVPAGVPSWA